MKSFYCLALLLVLSRIQAQDSSLTSFESKSALQLNFNLIDLPYNSYGSKTFENKLSTQNQLSQASFGRYYTFLSPDQALTISNDIVGSLHWGIAKLPIFKRKKGLRLFTKLALAAFGDVILLSAPYGAGWMHEEGHRAIMVNSYVFSYNPIIFNKRKEDASTAEFQSVSYVLDSNLAMMKAKDNANFVRLSTMGGEMQNYAMVKMQQQNFFRQTQGKGNALQLMYGFNYMLNFLNNTSYYMLCADSVANSEATISSIKNEGNKQYLRDFTGLDFAAWAYDLNRPNEAYAARGQNPYGNGYNRYIYGNRLSDDEYKWLKKQVRLSFLNLVSPLVVNLPNFNFGPGNSMAINFSLRHYPTSFGNQIGLDLFLHTPQFAGFVGLHLNQNKQSNFPGIEVLVNEYKIPKTKQMSVTARMIVDLQPRDQLFASTKSAATLLGSLQGNYVLGNNFKLWCVLEAKNRGWIAGNAFLDKNVSARLGLSVYLGK